MRPLAAAHIAIARQLTHHAALATAEHAHTQAQHT